jgi:hypothetical protein
VLASGHDSTLNIKQLIVLALKPADWHTQQRNYIFILSSLCKERWRKKNLPVSSVMFKSGML